MMVFFIILTVLLSINVLLLLFSVNTIDIRGKEKLKKYNLSNSNRNLTYIADRENNYRKAG
ncbi:hypothetical protein GTQ40_02075 [Flavobacteriaceae bacterium R38]|nr:hypothetical protein [Flavobacteriaceae bacterium R38]